MAQTRSACLFSDSLVSLGARHSYQWNHDRPVCSTKIRIKKKTSGCRIDRRRETTQNPTTHTPAALNQSIYPTSIAIAKKDCACLTHTQTHTLTQTFSHPISSYFVFLSVSIGHPLVLSIRHSFNFHPSYSFSSANRHP